MKKINILVSRFLFSNIIHLKGSERKFENNELTLRDTVADQMSSNHAYQLLQVVGPDPDALRGLRGLRLQLR